MELREEIIERLVEECPHVDSCNKKCTPEDHLRCYQNTADSIINLLANEGYGKLTENNPDLPYVIGNQFQPIERVK